MNTPELLNRRGRFTLPENLVKDHPEAVMEVMGQCVILRCEMRYDRMQFEYSAVSPQFNVVVDCVVAPEYGAQFESVNVGTEEAPVMRAEFIGFVPDTHINGSR